MRKIFSFINEKRKKIQRKIIYQDILKINPKKILDDGGGINGSFDYNEFKDKIVSSDILQGIDCQSLPYKNNQFDCVIFAGVIQYIENPDKAMKEVCRVLKPKGHLILATINKHSLIKKITGFKEEKQAYTLKEFKSLAEKYGFNVLDEKILDFWFIPRKYKMGLYLVCKKI